MTTWMIQKAAVNVSGHRQRKVFSYEVLVTSTIYIKIFVADFLTSFAHCEANRPHIVI